MVALWELVLCDGAVFQQRGQSLERLNEVRLLTSPASEVMQFTILLPSALLYE